nr:hypothetical protein CFP56_52884 [Quercus suber]
MTLETSNPRRQPCVVLRNCGIPSVVWFEDAIRQYGVPTVLFDLYLLVPDIEVAARILERNGWKPIPQQRGRIGNAFVDLAQYPQRRLASPTEDFSADRYIAASQTLTRPVVLNPADYEQPTIVLLPAAEWNFTFPIDTLPNDFTPSLEDLIDGLLDSMLDCSDLQLQDHLNVQLAYLYDHVPEMQEKAFADGLRYEHRQYHLDIRSGMNFGTLPFIAHQRNVRDALRDRRLGLQECSATHDNEDLFNNAVQARLLASLSFSSSQDTEKVEATA